MAPEKRTTASGIRYSYQSVPSPTTSSSSSSSVHLRLVCHVGSLHETDAQRGAAHYIEHLGFRATRQYGHGELVSLVTSFGSGFGPDLNAQTGLCETVWQLDLPKLDLLPVGLAILNEWAFWIRISDEDVDAERGVILEEYRHKQTAGQRAKSMFWDLALPLVAQRIPIGTLDFIQSVTAGELGAFYREHYVSQNLSVVCVVEQGNGDDAVAAAAPFTVDDFARMMEQCFSPDNCPVRRTVSTIASPPPPPSPVLLLPVHRLLPALDRSTKSACIIDPDLVQAAVSIELLTAPPLCSSSSNHDVAFFRRDVVKRVLSSIMDERFRHAMLESEAPLYSALGFSVCTHEPYIELSTLKTTFVLSPQHTGKDIARIFIELLGHAFAAARSGFSSEEVAHAKMKWRRNTAQRQVTGLGATEEWLEHFRMKEQSPMWPFAEEQERVLDLLGDGPDAISTEEVCAFCRDWLQSLVAAAESTPSSSSSPSPCKLLLFFQANRLPTGMEHATLLHALECARTSDDVFLNAPSASPSPLPQFDYCEEQLRKSVLTWTAPAGASAASSSASSSSSSSVLHHQVQLLPKTQVELHRFALGGREMTVSVVHSEEKKISLQAFALGGASELDSEVDDVCFSLCGDILRESGLGESLSGSDLLRLEACTSTRVFMQRHLHHRGLGGSSPSHELELMLHMIALRCETFKVDSKVLTRVLQREKEALQEDAMSEVQCAMRELGYGTQERLLLPHTLQDLENVTQDRLASVAQAAFGNCSEFTFCLIGGHLPNEYGRILEGFAQRVLSRTPPPPAVSAAPSSLCCFRKQPAAAAITPMKLTFDCPAPTRVLYQGETDTDKSQVTLIMYPGAAASAADNDDVFMSTALCEAIRLRLLSRLRTDRAQVYSVSCEYSFTTLASNASRMFVSFSCGVERDVELVDTTKQLLREMAVWGFSPVETDTAYALMATKRSKSNTDSHRLFRVLDAYKICGGGNFALADELAHRNGAGGAGEEEQEDAEERKERLKRQVRGMVAGGINAMVIRHRPRPHHKL